MESDFQTIEINGIKLEIDLRTARRVESYKIGDRVKVLVKEYSDKYTPHPGVIVGFDAFEKLPTITVAYLEISYSGAEIKFAYINKDKEDGVEIAPYHDDILVDKAETIKKLDKSIATKQNEIEDLEAKKAYFERNFAAYFADFDDLVERVDG